MVAVEPLDDAGLAQRLEPAHMGFHIALVIVAGNVRRGAGDAEMLARLVDAAVLSSKLSNGPVGPSRSCLGRPDPNNVADGHGLGVSFRHLEMVNPPVEPIDHEVLAVGHLIAGK